MNNGTRTSNNHLMISRRRALINDGLTAYMEWSLNENGDCQTEVNIKGYFAPINGTVDISVTCTDPIAHRRATENALDAALFKLTCMGLLISKVESVALVLIAKRTEMMEQFSNITHTTDDAFPWEHNGFLGKK